VSKRQPPRLSPATAVELLALVDHSVVAAPAAPLEYLRGFLVARSWEPMDKSAPRRDTHPSPGCSLAVDGSR
jgi:hypothetical protein